MEAVAFAALLAIKLAIYSAWCWLALRFIASTPPSWKRAMAHGVLRIALGLVLGFSLVVAVGWIAPASNRLGLSAMPLLVLVAPMRYLEWSVVGMLLLRRERNLRGLFAGPARLHAWRVGGVVLSFLTDVGAILGISAAGLIPC